MKKKITHNIAFIIPVKNEEETITDVLSSIVNHFPESFICVVINDSIDYSKTKSISFFDNNKINKNNYLMLNLVKPGKANAVKQALQQVTANYYILIDADNQHNANDAKTLLNTMKSYDADMVIGSRFLKEKKTNHIKYDRQRLNMIYNQLVNLLFNINVTDALSGFRILNNSFVKTLNIKSNNFELEAELLVHLVKGNYKLKEIPISNIKRSFKNKSKLNLVIDGLQIMTFTIINYLKIKW